ncbi:MAG TPA: isoprenylcysteine carboxyl methyltransferase [Armatimonadetes bacterium]|nr:isoprenylcysteine carboxyl methyltransferase [Armatimonadota bacterium]
MCPDIPNGTPQTELHRGTRRFLIKAIASIPLTAAVLFVSAGTVRWPMAWAYVLIGVATVLAMLLIVMPKHPDLIAERSRMHPDTKPWDRVLAPLGAAGTAMANMIVGGLDYRLGWAPEIPLWGQLVGMLLVLIASTLVIWAMYENRFFSATVRIQTDRGHTVCSDGPYQYVRHPGYSAWILLAVGVPIMLGSARALIVTAVSFVAIVLRTWLEDATLARELPGYEMYRQRVRYRLIPGVW